MSRGLSPNQAGTRTTAVAYIRVSTEKQELSPDAQRSTLDMWAQVNDIKIVAWFEDRISGGVPWAERPGLAAAVAELRTRQADWLVVARTDRLSRDLFNQLHLQKYLEQYNARWIAATESPDDKPTPEKELLQNVLGATAQFERSLIRQRIKEALDERKKQGVKLGRDSYGDTEIGRCLVWAVWTLFDQGFGMHRIAKRLNDLGVRGPRGGGQHVKNIHDILHRPRPAARPAMWCGIEDTFKQFSYDGLPDIRSKNLARNSGDPATKRGRPPGRRSKSSGDVVEATATADRSDVTQ